MATELYDNFTSVGTQRILTADVVQTDTVLQVSGPASNHLQSPGGQFRIIIINPQDQTCEIALVISGAWSSNWTVQRGVETLPLPFPAGSTIKHILTRDALSNIISEGGTGGTGGDGASGVQIIQDHGGVSLAPESILDFEGSGVTVTDDPTNNRTVVTIDGGAGGGNWNWQGFWGPSITYNSGDVVLSGGFPINAGYNELGGVFVCQNDGTTVPPHAPVTLSEISYNDTASPWLLLSQVIVQANTNSVVLPGIFEINASSTPPFTSNWNGVNGEGYRPDSPPTPRIYLDSMGRVTWEGVIDYMPPAVGHTLPQAKWDIMAGSGVLPFFLRPQGEKFFNIWACAPAKGYGSVPSLGPFMVYVEPSGLFQMDTSHFDGTAGSPQMPPDGGNGIILNLSGISYSILHDTIGA